MVGGINVLYALLYLARRHTAPRYLSTPQSKWMMLFFAIAFYSYITNDQVVVSLVSPIAMYVSAALLFFVTLSVVDSLRRLYWSLMVAVGSVAFASLYMLREYVKGSAVYGGQYRPGWVVGDPNYFTVAALVCLPIAFELFLISRRRWEKFYCIGCLLLVLVAITLGASRGGFLGMALDLSYLVFRSRRGMRNAFIILLVAIPFVLFAPNSPLSRIVHPRPGDTQSVEKHFLGWQAGFNMVKAHPFMGVGLGNYKSVVVQYDTSGLIASDPHVAHDSYLEVVAEMGIPALVVYLMFLGSTFLSLERTRKRALVKGYSELASLALGMQASLLGVWVAIFFVSGQYTKLFWFISAITMCMPALMAERKVLDKNPPMSERTTEASPVLVESTLLGVR